MMRCSRSVAAAATSDDRERQRRPQGRLAAEFNPSSHEQPGRDRLDERIAHRDPHSAVAALPAQHQPRDDRDVVVGTDGGVTSGAAGSWLHDRLPPWEPVREHVHEASERGTAEAQQHQFRCRCLHATRPRRVAPAGARRVSRCARSCRSGSRCTLNVTGFVESEASRSRTRSRSRSRSRGSTASFSEVCCSSSSARVTPA